MIHLTEQEQAKMAARAKLEQEMEDWKNGLAKKFAQQKIARKGYKRKDKVQKVEQNARKSVERLVQGIEKGWNI